VVLFWPILNLGIRYRNYRARWVKRKWNGLEWRGKAQLGDGFRPFEARQPVEFRAVSELTSRLADPSVGVVSGEADLHAPLNVMEGAPWG
jgi:hypothetical protein